MSENLYDKIFFDNLPTLIEFSIPKGWHKAFGKELYEDICEYYNNLPDAEIASFCIIDIKEKWGKLRISALYEDEKFFELERKYEKLSGETCAMCGKKATHVTKGWVIPICDECDKHRCPSG